MPDDSEASDKPEDAASLPAEDSSEATRADLTIPEFTDESATTGARGKPQAGAAGETATKRAPAATNANSASQAALGGDDTGPSWAGDDDWASLDEPQDFEPLTPESVVAPSPLAGAQSGGGSAGAGTGQAAAAPMGPASTDVSGPPPLLPKTPSVSTDVVGRTDGRLAGGTAPGRRGDLQLVCTGGADSGKAFPLKGATVVVGRGSQADVQLEDPSVSREHARLEKKGDRYSIKDLDSASGTRVNGRQVTEVRLNSGDELAFGQATFRLLQVGDVFKPVDTSGAPVAPGARGSLTHRVRTHPVATVAALIGAMALVVAGGVGWVLWTGRQHVGQGIRAEAAFGHYQQGIQAFRHGRWSEAEQQFSLMARVDRGNPQARRYAKAIAPEREAQVRVKSAGLALTDERLSEAYSKARASLDSVSYGEATRVMQSVETRFEGRLRRAREALQAGDGQAAAELLAGLGNIQPWRGDWQQLSRWAKGTKARSRQRWDEAARAAGAAGAGAGDSPAVIAGTAGAPASAPRQGGAFTAPLSATPAAPQAKAPVGLPSVAPELAESLALFEAGKISAAQKALAAVPHSDTSATLRTDFEAFQNAYEQALEAYAAKRPTSALRHLNKAYVFAQKLVRGRPPVLQRIDQQRVDMQVQLATQAIMADELPQAYQALVAARSLVPTDSRVGAKLAILADRARDLYNEGYIVRDTEPELALRRWQTVIRIVPADNVHHQKAQKRLAKLRQKQQQKR